MPPESAIADPPPNRLVPHRRKLGDFKPSRRVIWTDRIAEAVISTSGIFVIIAVALIIIFVGREALPLFYAPKSEVRPDLRSAAVNSSTMLTWSTDEFQTNSYGLRSDGRLIFISNADGSVAHDLAIGDLQSVAPKAAWVSPVGDRFIVIRADGKIKILTLSLGVSYDAEKNQVLTPSVSESALLEFPGTPGIQRLAATYNPVSEVIALAVLDQGGRLWAGTYSYASDLLEWKQIPLVLEGEPTGLAIDPDARFVVMTTDANVLYRWNLWREGDDKLVEKLKPSLKGSYPTSLEVLLGGFTYIIGFSDGSVEAWFGVRRDPSDTEFRLQKIREFQRHAAPVTEIHPSGVDRSFWTCDKTGVLKMHFNPSARKLYSLETGESIAGFAANTHLNGISVLGESGAIRQWTLDCPHPDVTLSTLFGQVWYEGYADPEFIWQSSSGSDNFEAKFSLTPLTVGTMKGALFGLIFAIPVAVLAALYVSQLMHPNLRTPIKGTLEIMAALPSVVIGFLAGLWMAPFLEAHLVAFFLVGPVMMSMIVAGAWCYFRLPRERRSKLPPQLELGILLGLVVLALWVSNLLAQPVENLFFGGNIQQWIYDNTGQKVEQRNSLVIGLAMGFAVIPIIFSISEDALSNVPRHYVSGSLALGATQWQSAIRVVLPTASPGIFSAIMLGFGRAVGETMIVLMATGNTPIMSLSPFNGMRTLAANIAVEIPEAPHAGTLYRILFLAAALLFVLTFIVNTAAELVRLRLREKYRAM